MEKKRKYDKRYCIAFGCLNNNKTSSDLSLFSLPKDDERRRVWLTSIGREDLLKRKNLIVKGYEVCVDHFDDSAIRTVKHLKPNAVPTKLLHKRPQQGGGAPGEKTPEHEGIPKLEPAAAESLVHGCRRPQHKTPRQGGGTTADLCRVAKSEVEPLSDDKIVAVKGQAKKTTQESKAVVKTPRKRKLSKDLRKCKQKKSEAKKSLKPKKSLENAFISSDSEESVVT